MTSEADGLSADDPAHYSKLELPRGDLWVFTYGSLMWDPGFNHRERAPALLRGYHRTFCVYSDRYRGTPQRPGLVLGLDAGGACRGTAYRVPRRETRTVLHNLWAREMRRRVYRPRFVKLELPGRCVRALAFLSDPGHRAYAGRLSVEAVATVIAKAHGSRGANIDYLLNTLQHLDALGVHDQHLHRILSAVRRITSRE